VQFWAELEDISGKTPSYADPSTNGDAEPKANSNCGGVTYTSFKTKPLPSAAMPWNGVSASKKNATGRYTLCGLSYVIALSKYAPYPGTSESEVRTVYDYLQYILDLGAEGGQVFLGSPGTDYAELVAAPLVQAIAEAGAGEISYP